MDTDRIFKLGCRTTDLTLRQGYGSEGRLSHERAQAHRRRLAGRERGGGRFLRVRLAASERSLSGGRAGGGEQSVIEGETLRHFVGSRGSMGLFCGPGSRPERRRGAYRLGRLSGARRTLGRGPWEYCPGPLPGRGAAVAPGLPERRHGARPEPRRRAHALRRLPRGEVPPGRARS